MASGFDQDEPAVAPTKPAGILAKERENGAAGASLLVQVGAKLRWVSTIPHFSLMYFFGSWTQTLFKHQVWSDQQLSTFTKTLSGRHRNAVGVFRLISFGTPTRVWTCHVTICDCHAAFGFCKLAKAPKLILGTMRARRTGRSRKRTEIAAKVTVISFSFGGF